MTDVFDQNNSENSEHGDFAATEDTQTSPLLLVGVVVLSILVIILGIVGYYWFGGTFIEKEKEPGSVEEQLTGAEAAFTNEEYDSAISLLKEANETNSELFEIHALLGRALVAEAHTDTQISPEEKENLLREALRHFNTAVSLGLTETYPEYQQFVRSYALAHWGVQEYDEANELFLELIERYPGGSFLARVFVARDYMERMNKPTEALEILSSVFRNSNATAYPELQIEANMMLMRLSTFAGNYEDTIKYADILTEVISQEDVESLRLTYTHRAAAASAAKDIDGMEEWLDKADEVVENPGQHTCLRAFMYFENGLYELALAAAENSEDASCWSVIARVHNAEGQTEKAKEYAQKALDTLTAVSERDPFLFEGIQDMRDIIAAN